MAPTILFACIHNSGRSVAAQVLAERYGDGRVTVRSAGSEPGATVNPEVAAVLADRGLSADDHQPSPLTYDGVQEADVVITMGCGETCPVFPGKTYEDWNVDDPAGRDRATVERIVEEIDVRVRDLLNRLGVCEAERIATAAGGSGVEPALVARADQEPQGER